MPSYKIKNSEKKKEIITYMWYVTMDDFFFLV